MSKSKFSTLWISAQHRTGLEGGNKESQWNLTYAPALGTEEFLACTHGHSLVDVSNPTLLVTPYWSISFWYLTDFVIPDQREYNRY